MSLPHQPMILGTIQITPRQSPRRPRTRSDQTLGDLLHCLAHQPSLASVEAHRGGKRWPEQAVFSEPALQPDPPIVLADLRQLLRDLRREFACLSRRQGGGP